MGHTSANHFEGYFFPKLPWMECWEGLGRINYANAAPGDYYHFQKLRMWIGSKEQIRFLKRYFQRAR